MQHLVPVLGAGLALLGLLSSCGQVTPEPPTPTPQPKIQIRGTILAVGDSLTEGLGVAKSEAYPALLEQMLQENGYPYQVVNAGVSGETSSGTLSRVDWILNSEEKPDIIILETGGNDGLRAIDPDLTQENLEAIINRFQENGVDVVLAGMQTIQNLGEDYTEAYAAVYPAVAEENNLILIPFFLEGVAAERSLNQEDGIHPTAEGYQVVAETVYPYVVEAIERRQTAQ
jgi:acyl-CoA thioesterase-1